MRDTRQAPPPPLHLGRPEGSGHSETRLVSNGHQLSCLWSRTAGERGLSVAHLRFSLSYFRQYIWVQDSLSSFPIFMRLSLAVSLHAKCLGISDSSSLGLGYRAPAPPAPHPDGSREGSGHKCCRPVL